MRLLTFQGNDGWRLGIKVPNGVIDIPAASNQLGTALLGEPVPHRRGPFCQRGWRTRRFATTGACCP
jgi:hypothetical protein